MRLEGEAIDHALAAMAISPTLRLTTCRRLSGRGGARHDGRASCLSDAVDVMTVRLKPSSTMSAAWRCRPRLAKGGAALAGRVGAGQAARVPHRARVSRSACSSRASRRSQANHERFDGSGYRAVWRGRALRPPARVLAAADAYHAMTGPRPNREALPRDRAAETLGREANAAGWTAMPSPPCSKPPESARRESSGRQADRA